MRTITGRPVLIEELAQPLPPRVHRSMTAQYAPGDVDSTIDYLLSETPMDETLWMHAEFEAIPYEVGGQERTLYTNPHSEGCVRDVLRGSLDISEYVADLARLLPLEINDRERLKERLTEITLRLEKGLEKGVV